MTGWCWGLRRSSPVLGPRSVAWVDSSSLERRRSRRGDKAQESRAGRSPGGPRCAASHGASAAGGPVGRSSSRPEANHLAAVTEMARAAVRLGTILLLHSDAVSSSSCPSTTLPHPSHPRQGPVLTCGCAHVFLCSPVPVVTYICAHLCLCSPVLCSHVPVPTDRKSVV